MIIIVSVYFTKIEVSMAKSEIPLVEEELVVVVAWVVGVELQSHWLSLLQLSVSQIQISNLSPYPTHLFFLLVPHFLM